MRALVFPKVKSPAPGNPKEWELYRTIKKEQAAEFLGVTPETLESMRQRWKLSGISPFYGDGSTTPWDLLNAQEEERRAPEPPPPPPLINWGIARLAKYFQQPRRYIDALRKCTLDTEDDPFNGGRKADPIEIVEWFKRNVPEGMDWALIHRRARVRRAKERRPDPLLLAKRKAWHEVHMAVREGRLVPRLCEECFSPDAEAHHDDYFKPLEVRWLCKKHHGKADASRRRRERAHPPKINAEAAEPKVDADSVATLVWPFTP